MSNYNSLQDELKKLKAVKKALNVKKHRHEVYKLAILVDEILKSVREADLKYYFLFTGEDYKAHAIRFFHTAKRNKCRAIEKLQELIHQLSRKEVNIQRCNVLLDYLIENEFFIKSTERFMERAWKPLRKKDFNREYFTV